MLEVDWVKTLNFMNENAVVDMCERYAGHFKLRYASFVKPLLLGRSVFVSLFLLVFFFIDGRIDSSSMVVENRALVLILFGSKCNVIIETD